MLSKSLGLMIGAGGTSKTPDGVGASVASVWPVVAGEVGGVGGIVRVEMSGAGGVSGICMATTGFVPAGAHSRRRKTCGFAALRSSLKTPVMISYRRPSKRALYSDIRSKSNCLVVSASMRCTQCKITIEPSGMVISGLVSFFCNLNASCSMFGSGKCL